MKHLLQLSSAMPQWSVSSLKTTKHQRQRWQNVVGPFSVYFWSVWNMCYNLVSASSADNPFLFCFFTVLGTAVLFFFVGPLWCNYFGVHRNKNRNTYLIFESFPSPYTQTFHPIWWFCYFSRTFVFAECSLDSQDQNCFARMTQCNNSSRHAWKSKKRQYMQFVFYRVFEKRFSEVLKL